MECVEGGALVDWIEAHGAMPAALALSVTIEVARAIEYAHANGVILEILNRTMYWCIQMVGVV